MRSRYLSALIFLMAQFGCSSWCNAEQLRSVIILVKEDGTKLQVDPRAILRIRGVTPSELSFHTTAATLIDYAIPLFVRDTQDSVVSAVASSGSTIKLGKLRQPNGSPLWFDGKRSEGPVPVPDAYLHFGIHSALYIGGKVQYVQNEPDEVRSIIEANAGSALPSLAEARSSAASKNIGGAPTAWDSDVPELSLGQK